MHARIGDLVFDKLLCLSTAHLPLSQLEDISNGHHSHRICPYAEGFILRLCDLDNVDAIKSFGMPPLLAQSIYNLLNAGVRFIQFDCDETRVIQGAEIYEHS